MLPNSDSGKTGLEVMFLDKCFFETTVVQSHIMIISSVWTCLVNHSPFLFCKHNLATSASKYSVKEQRWLFYLNNPQRTSMHIEYWWVEQKGKLIVDLIPMMALGNLSYIILGEWQHVLINILSIKLLNFNGYCQY